MTEELRYITIKGKVFEDKREALKQDMVDCINALSVCTQHIKSLMNNTLGENYDNAISDAKKLINTLSLSWAELKKIDNKNSQENSTHE